MSSGRWQDRVRTFPHAAREAAFLLGGIGTGNVSLGARGDLRDWEIFNRPAKGLKIPYSFFALFCRGTLPGSRGVARILEAPAQPPYAASHGLGTGTVAGLPHMEGSLLSGAYPFANVAFRDHELPVEVSLEAFSPFIPLDADASGIPGAFLSYHVRNTSRERLSVSIAGSLPNVVGFKGFDAFGNLLVQPGGKNDRVEEADCGGLLYSSTGCAPQSLDHGTMCLATTSIPRSVRAEWLDGNWFDGIQDFWDDFSDDGRLSSESSYHAPGSRIRFQEDRPPVGSVCVARDLDPGEETDYHFILSWHFPFRLKGWRLAHGTSGASGAPGSEPPLIRNYYATLFADAWDVCRHLARNRTRLEGLSRRFQEALYSSTLPPEITDALGANITVIRSPTCFRLEDGTFASWEGCHDSEGCCEGSCTHVWNYAQTLAFLFPELERTMRRVEFNVETDDDGRMAFRTRRIFGLPAWEMLPAADGQLGAVIRLYRDWKLSGDEEFLRSVWPKAARSMDFAFDFWDSDGDCVLDSEQHNTYDIEFYGVSSLTSSIFYAALKAAAEIAGHLGDTERQARYQRARDEGSRRMDELLWNGEYYVQSLPDVDRYRYQYGQGCLSDQLLGQSLAHTAGLGYVLPMDHVKSALRAVVRHNFKPTMRGTANPQRTFALEDESGLVLCSWPRGGRPRLPFVYCDEVWTGIEYQVAAHLIHEGLVEEGRRLVRAVRDRHDGFRRNPWDEVECGHHYVRSLASWALLVALSGFHYDVPARRISFSPRAGAAEFACFFSTGTAWGIYREHAPGPAGSRSWGIEVIFGDLSGFQVNGEEMT